MRLFRVYNGKIGEETLEWVGLCPVWGELYDRDGEVGLVRLGLFSDYDSPMAVYGLKKDRASRINKLLGIEGDEDFWEDDLFLEGVSLYEQIQYDPLDMQYQVLLRKLEEITFVINEKEIVTEEDIKVVNNMMRQSKTIRVEIEDVAKEKGERGVVGKVKGDKVVSWLERKFVTDQRMRRGYSQVQIKERKSKK